MATSLLDGLNGLVTPELLSTAAGQTGESEAALGAGLGGSFSTILAGLAGQAGNTEAMRPVFELITSPANDGSFMRNPRLAVTASRESPLGAAGTGLVSRLFGSALSPVCEVIARTAGLRSASGGSILSMAAPLVLSFLGYRVRSGKLKAAGLGDLLLSERDQITRALPAGLSSIPGVEAVLGTTGSGRGAPGSVPMPRASAPGGLRRLRPVLVALVLVAVLWGLSRGRRPAVDETVGAVSGAVTETAAGILGFRCGDQRISLGRTADRPVLTTGAGTFALHQVDAASGDKYEALTDASTTFWSKGDQASLTIRGQSYPTCTRER